ncbi:TPA: hypothetical protein NNQ18_004603 [Salmonella enterica]|nr:hypothetical protein [Salmonella enterica]HCH9056043.1 hypothetical protein [Salmonella enterica]
MSKKFYVYGVYGADDELLYVGKGTGNRFTSHLRGASSNRFVNEYFFSNGQDGCIYSKKLYEDLTEQEAFDIEKELIASLKPHCNLALNVTFKNRLPSEILAREVIEEKARIFNINHVISCADLPDDIVISDSIREKLNTFISLEPHLGKQKVYLSLLINGNTGSKHLSEMVGVSQRTAKRWLLEFEERGLDIGKVVKLKKQK